MHSFLRLSRGPVLSSLKSPTLAMGLVFQEVAWGSPFPSLHAVLLGSCHLHFLHSYISQSSVPVCTLSQRGTRVHAETVLLFLCFCSPRFKCKYISLLFCMKKNPTISWVGSLKRCRPLKHFLGVWAKTNNNFVITCLTDSADTQIANRFGCFYSQMLCPFLLHFPFSVRSWEIFYSFKNKTRSFFADHTDFFNISHTRIYI